MILMLRAAIYARYSSDKQSEASAEDQARLCQERADREGWNVVATFADLAISGAVRDRPGLQALIGRAGEFDVVLAESIDRLSRDQEDIAAVFKQLRFAGARIVTLADGDVSELHIGLKGTMGALFLKDLGEKTRRGQLGRHAAGRIPSGLSYGYAKRLQLNASGEPERGLRDIDDAQANVVRRIFAEFLDNRSPKAIAAGLNRDGIASPSGGLWRASAIAGNRLRGTGILHNELYIGRIVFDRQHFDKHPITRKRVARLNPRSQWRVHEAPEMRIVEQATWEAKERRFDALTGVPAHQQRRPRRLLSGVMRCGVCQGTVTVIGKERWGCSGHQQGTGCSNGRTVSNAQAEARVLAAMRDHLLHPDVVKEYVTAYHQRLEEDRLERLKERASLERQLARTQGRIDRIVMSIADGAKSFPEIHDTMRQLSVERDRLQAELADIEATTVIALSPAIAERYRRTIDELVAGLRNLEGDPITAQDQLRAALDVIYLVPREVGRGVHLDVVGRLAEILRIAEGRPPATESALERMLVLVAGTGFEPVTFRL